MLSAILAAVAPILITVALGFYCARTGRVLIAGTMTLLVADVGTPCLIFSTLANTAVPPAAFAATALASATAIAGFLAAGALVLYLTGMRQQTYLAALAFPNTGNLGLPLALYGFGTEGLGYAVVFYALAAIGNYTIGQALVAGAANWRAILRMPLVYAVILGMLAAYFHIVLPRWLGNTISLIAGIAVPLMLLMLGASLSALKVAAFRRATMISALRIGLGAAIGVAVAALFGLAGTARSILILQSAMPVAVYTYLFALRWNHEPEEIAGLIVVSTFLSLLTVPLLLYWLLPAA